MEHMITINGAQFALDIFNPDCAERYETAVNRMASQIKRMQDEKAELSFADNIRRQCKAVTGCLDELFGEDAARHILGEETNLRSCLQAFGSLVSQVNRQKQELDDIILSAQKGADPAMTHDESAD